MSRATRATSTEKVLQMRSCTIVDSTTINAPPLTKNSDGKRHGDMSQTKKGIHWHYDLKVHIGADDENGLVDTFTTTAANMADITETAALMHGQERTAFADVAYTGAEKREELQCLTVDRQIAARRSTVKKINLKLPLLAVPDGLEHAKASIRTKVGHSFYIVNSLFRHCKARYKILVKDTMQVMMLFGLANLVLPKNKLLLLHTNNRSIVRNIGNNTNLRQIHAPSAADLGRFLKN